MILLRPWLLLVSIVPGTLLFVVRNFRNGNNLFWKISSTEDDHLATEKKKWNNKEGAVTGGAAVLGSLLLPKADDVTTTLTIPLEKQVPRLIIAGAQKGGTTALLGILKKLPGKSQFLSNSKNYPETRETHFFNEYVHKDFGKDRPFPGTTLGEWQAFLRDEETGLTDNVLQALSLPWGRNRVCAGCREQYQRQHGLLLIAARAAPFYVVW